ncbi:hypothetical protein ADK52_11660 [Streptomyces sp. WM6372]|uniref:hypothetical protein n=1 Tax=Streptomyces sp. WM6372 TaxID=1415555 RepID=UPI0006AEF198|nr:hypothetical protein [Streptomyces sp. WM6372]KOU25679.1 hypothetical protein ADK52_11660 [Streptomyces sp. WM6372]
MTISEAGAAAAGAAPPADPASPAPPAGPSATADGGIDRLNPFDGLFLRAEHLSRIQDYARELALAVGAAGGPGVVEGYEVSVKDGTLRVGGGLAVSPEGRPLRSQRLVTLPLTGLDPGLDGFWWVEVAPDSRPYGDAPVQGSYCDDPCAGSGTTRRPYLAEGVRIQLAEGTEPGLDNQLPASRRNFLASRIFGAERTGHSPWPYGTGSAHLPQSWTPPAASPGRPRTVRIAVLLRDPGRPDGWEVDTWAARRDRAAAPPQRYWQSRLGMRPWDAYTAQILQFQDQLAQVLGAAPAPAADLGPLLEQLALIGEEQFLKSHTKDQLGREVARLITGIGEGALIRPAQAGPGPYALQDLGIAELPPAGYLPYTPEPEQSAGPAGIRALLGGQVELRYCSCALPDVARAVQEAQHRDRIRLDEPVGVDILLPVDDRAAPVGDWVAFVRREQRHCYDPG